MKNIIAKYKRNYIRRLEIIIVKKQKQIISRFQKKFFFATFLIFTPLFFITLIIEPERFLYVGFGIASLVSYTMLKNKENFFKTVNVVVIQYVLLVLVFLIAIYVGIVTNKNNYAVVLPVLFALVPTLFIIKRMFHQQSMIA